MTDPDNVDESKGVENLGEKVHGQIPLEGIQSIIDVPEEMLVQLGLFGSSKSASGSPLQCKGSSSTATGLPYEGYNIAYEEKPHNDSDYDEMKEYKFENDLRIVKGLEIIEVFGDGNCLFRAVADQVYGNVEEYDLVRQKCIDYMEKERSRFSMCIAEDFKSYCDKKRMDKVYGDHVEIQAISEVYNRPIHIYSYSTEPLNILQGDDTADKPPIRLSYHRQNHYNLVYDPRPDQHSSYLPNVDIHKENAAVKAKKDKEIDNSDDTDMDTKQMIMNMIRLDLDLDNMMNEEEVPIARKSSTSNAEPSSSAVRCVETDTQRTDSIDEGI